MPPSGNMEVLGKQFWLGTARAGMTIRFWASTEIIHLTIGGAQVKSVLAPVDRRPGPARRQRAQPGRPAPGPGGRARRSDRGRPSGIQRRACQPGRPHYITTEILGGTLVSIRIENDKLMFFDPATRPLLRIRPSPLTWAQARLLRGARPNGPPNRSPSSAGASNTGVIMVAWEKIALGRIHAGQVVAAKAVTIDLGGEDTRTIRRTTTQPVRLVKAHRPHLRSAGPLCPAMRS